MIREGEFTTKAGTSFRISFKEGRSGYLMYRLSVSRATELKLAVGLYGGDDAAFFRYSVFPVFFRYSVFPVFFRYSVFPVFYNWGFHDTAFLSIGFHSSKQRWAVEMEASEIKDLYGLFREAALLCSKTVSMEAMKKASNEGSEFVPLSPGDIRNLTVYKVLVLKDTAFYKVHNALNSPKWAFRVEGGREEVSGEGGFSP